MRKRYHNYLAKELHEKVLFILLVTSAFIIGRLTAQFDAIEERYQRSTATLIPAVTAAFFLATSAIFHFDDEPIHIVVLIFVGILIGTLITMEKRRRRE